MEKFIVELTEKAKNDLAEHKKSGNKAAEKKIKKILVELEEHPYNPEALKYELTGKWSRYINQKDRLIYTVNENIVAVEVLSAMGHCSDN